MNKQHKIKTIRSKMADKIASIGSWMQIPNSSVAEVMGQSGYDWIAVDLEHGSFSLHQLPDIFRAIELGGTLPLARLAQGGEVECKQVLDAGAAGVIVPMIRSSEQLEIVRDFCRWPPSGRRGVAYSRANLFGKNFDEYSAEAQAPLLIAMLEHIEAVEKLDKILNVHGLDGILIGPYDLSASMKITGDFANAYFQEVVKLISTKCQHKNIPYGTHVVTPSYNRLQENIKSGELFIAYSIDSVFLTHSAQMHNEQ